MWFINMPMQFVWLVLAVVFGIIEAVTLGLFTLWFALAALVAMVAAMLGLPFEWQLIVFIISSALLLYFTKPFIKKHLKVKEIPTNADRVIGLNGIVIENIDSIKGTGQVKVAGQIWSALAADGEDIEAGQLVKIERIAGVKVIVERQLVKTESNAQDAQGESEE